MATLAAQFGMRPIIAEPTTASTSFELRNDSERLFAHEREHRIESKGHQEHEQRHLKRVLERAFHDGSPTAIVRMVMMGMLVGASVCAIVVLVHELGIALAGIAPMIAIAMVALANLVDVQVLVVAMRRAHDDIHGKAKHHANDRLHAQYAEQNVNRHLLGDEDGKHLVGRGQEHGEQRAQPDDTPRVERGRRRREPALRHHAEHRAHGRARLASAARWLLLRLLPRLVLEPFHRKIGHEQKRYEIQRVEDRILQHVKRHVRKSHSIRHTLRHVKQLHH